jgi:hypothetical protein
VPAPAPATPEVDPRRVVTPLDADGVEALLARFGLTAKWAHVVRGVRDGFDVGVAVQLDEMVVHPNHGSSELDPSFIDAYIAKEQAAGRYSEAFSPDELESAIGPFITSPFGLVPKGTDSWRPIQDFSYPRNHVWLLVVMFFIIALML